MIIRNLILSHLIRPLYTKPSGDDYTHFTGRLLAKYLRQYWQRVEWGGSSTMHGEVRVIVQNNYKQGWFFITLS